MQANIVRAVVIASVALSASLANAGPQTLDYTSTQFTSTYDNGSGPGNVVNGSYFTLELTLTSPLGDNFNGNASSLMTHPMTFTIYDGGKLETFDISPSQGAGSSFDFITNSSGAITGWDFTSGLTSSSSPQSDVLFHSCFNDNCASSSYNGQGYGIQGDWYDYQPGSSTAADGCSYTYIPNSKTPCGGSSTSTAAGKWITAPELSASSAYSGVVFLLGGLAVLGGRRRSAFQTRPS